MTRARVDRGLLWSASAPAGATHPIERRCWKCGAEAGQPCQGKRRERIAFHRERGSRISHAIDHKPDGRTESPIEDVLAGAILGWIDYHGISDAAMKTQEPVGPYRADILIECAGQKLVVECDGAAFHNEPDQIARDKRRDRFCATQGIAVMRFTGAEITRDPRRCAAEVGVWIRGRR